MPQILRHAARRWASPQRRDALADLLLFSVVAAVVVAPWARGGWLLLLDWVNGPRSTVSSGLYGLDAHQADAMPARLAMSVVRGVVGAQTAAWLPFAAALVLGGMGVSRLVGGPLVRRWTAGLLFVVNPFVFERLRVGHVWLLLAMAVLPWLLSSALVAHRDGRWFRVRTALWMALGTAVSAHFFWLGGVLLLAVGLLPLRMGGRALVRSLVRTLATVAAAVMTAAYGIVVALVGVRSTEVDGTHLDAFATTGEGMLGVLGDVLTLHGFWRADDLPRDMLGPWWPLLVVALFALATSGWLSMRAARVTSDETAARGSLAAIALALVLTGAVLAGGHRGPLGGLYRLAFEHLPMFKVMREPQKFAALVALGMAVLVGHGAESLVARVRSLRVRRPAIAALVALPLVVTPTMMWGLGGTVATSSYPASWAAAEEAMGVGDGAVLMLPWHQYQPYQFTDGRTVHTPAAAYFSRPVLTSESPELAALSADAASPRHTYLDQVMARGATLTHLGQLVAPLGVEYVVVTTTSAADSLPEWLDRQVDLEAVLRLDDLVVYRNTTHGTGRVGAARTVASVADYIDGVEAGTIGSEAVFVDPLGGSELVAASSLSGGLSATSATRFVVEAGEPGWVVVPTPAATGWAAGGTGGRATVQGVLAFAAGERATTVVYTPWSAVRLGYLVSAVSMLALLAFGLAEHRRRLAGSRLLRALYRRGLPTWRRFVGSVGPAYLGVWLVATLSVTSWFRPGTFIATGDIAPFIRRGWQPEAWWSWGHSVTGAGSATYTMSRWYELLLTRVVSTLGGTDTLSQRLLYMTIYPMVALAIASLAAVFTRNRWAIFAAGSFAVLNGFFLTRLPNPLNIISVGSTALVAAVGLRVAKGRRMPASALALAMLPMSFLSFNPPMLVVALAWTALGVPLVGVMMWGRAAIMRVVRYALAAAPWAVLVNVFWLVPFAQAFGGGGGASATAQTDPTAWAWSQAENSIPNVLTLSANWAWHKPQYLPFTDALDQPWWYWMRFVLPALLALAPMVARPRHRRTAITLVTLVLVFTLLGKGLQPPLSNLNMFLYDNVPGFWLFREPMSKLGQLLVMFDAVLLALVVDGSLARVRRLPRLWRVSGRSVVALAIGFVLAWPYPLFTGSVIPDERPLQPPAHVALPSYWRATADLIDADPTPGKVLVLPLDDYYQMPTTWGFSGSDTIAGLLLQRPVLQRKPDGYFGDTPGVAAQVDAVERALVAGDHAAVRPLLESLGVAFVMVRHDLVVGDPLRTFTDPDLLSTSIARVDGLEQVQDSTLEVFRVTGGSEAVRTEGTPLVVPADPDAIADTVASAGVGAGPVVVGDGDAVDPGVRDTAPGDDALVAADAVWWPVPAVQEGDASTTFTTDGGTFTVHQRSRAAVSVVPAETLDPSSPDDGVLQLVDPTVVLLDGEPVSMRAVAEYPLARPGVVAVTAGNRTVSLDGWLQASLPEGTSGAGGPTVVPIAAATPLTAWALADEQPKLTGYTEVYDCNNYEPRPAAELGLDAEVTPGDGTETVRLRALDHAACVSSTVSGVGEGDTLRVRIEYRTITGKRPHVCLLEVLEDGTNSCVPDARLRQDGEWGRYELVHTLGPGVVSAKVVLYANVGLRLSDPTESEYRGLVVERVESVLDTVAWPADVQPVQVELTPGEHTLTVVGGAYGSILAPFEALEDCFRYDDLSVEEAQLAATVSDDDGRQVYELRAKDHMACIAAALPDYGGNGLYTLHYEYRSVAVRKPKVCLYERGPNVCEPMPANGSETEWTEYRRLMRPRLASEETRLYLYGLRDLQGEQQSIVQYRDVYVTPHASATSVVLLRVTDTGPESGLPEPTVLHPTPISYRVTVDELVDGMVVTLAETWAPGWSLTGLPDGVTATRLRLNGYQNAWVLHVPPTYSTEHPVEVRLTYTPALTARTALKISLLIVPLAASWAWWGWRVRRRLAWRRLNRSRRRS